MHADSSGRTGFVSELPVCCLKHEALQSQRDFLTHKYLNFVSSSCLLKALCWLEICLTQKYSSWHSRCSHVAADVQSYEQLHWFCYCPQHS